MNIHEYQAKQIYREVGLPTTPEGRICHTPEEAVAAFQEFGGALVVIKAQVHMGGRGKAGGVKLARTAEEAKTYTQGILGLDIKGHVVRKVLVEKASDIAREAYLSVVTDRAGKGIGFIASAEGGMDIEEVAAQTPEKILRASTISLAFPEAEARAIAGQLFPGANADDAVLDVMRKLFDLFVKKDLTLAEINPLILTPTGEVRALDGKISVDDNALFRHPELEALRDLHEEDPNEIEARGKGLSFIQLDGDIGCMVNGAGLAMATVDMINLYGGKPSNFLDVGGSSNPEKVVHAFDLILRKGGVKAILINIFGGITRCDDIAKGILEAYKRMTIPVPVVVRLSGTNAKEGQAMLVGSPLVPAETLAEAVQKAVALGRGAA
jgi:succinyl-CoA synthetase beta subunit